MQSAIDDGRIGNAQSGIAKMKVLAAANPGDADIWTALGDLNRDAEHVSRGVGGLYQGYRVSIKPTDSRLASLFYARAIAYEHSNRWPAAEADLQQALKLSPNRADILKLSRLQLGGPRRTHAGSGCPFGKGARA